MLPWVDRGNAFVIKTQLEVEKKLKIELLQLRRVKHQTEQSGETFEYFSGRRWRHAIPTLDCELFRFE